MKFPILARALSLLLLATALHAQTPSDQIRSEVTRLRQQAAPTPDSDTKASLLKTLQRTEVATTRKQDYLALEELATAHIMAQALKDDQLKLDPANGMGQFEAEFKRAQSEFAAADKRARARTWRNVPEAVRAIAEISQAKTLVLLEATRPYAMATGPLSGMLYIGQARATVQTSDFAASLKVVSQKAPRLRSILPELQTLQGRVNAAFKPPRSIERHSEFIRLNSSLKMAFELDAARLYAGAMYRYLEAVRLLEMMDAPEVKTPPDIANAGAGIALDQNKSRSSQRDDSIAELFLQKAKAFELGRDGTPPSADDLKNAAVIRTKVLPAYFAAQNSTPAKLTVQAKTITVTLVRWPYT
jgi:hypothetical protein